MGKILRLGVNTDTERMRHDFYATDPWAIYKMAGKFKEIGISSNVWEPACGAGHMAEALRDIGYSVTASDIEDYGYERMWERLDFLKCDKTPWGNDWRGDIITNPPFSLSCEFVEKSMELLKDGHKAAFLLKIYFLETPKRAELFKKCGLKHVIVDSERVSCAANGDFDRFYKKRDGRYVGGTQCYAWFVFEKGYTGEATISTV